MLRHDARTNDAARRSSTRLSSTLSTTRSTFGARHTAVGFVAARAASVSADETTGRAFQRIRNASAKTQTQTLKHAREQFTGFIENGRGSLNKIEERNCASSIQQVLPLFLKSMALDSHHQTPELGNPLASKTTDDADLHREVLRSAFDAFDLDG